jgi:hypothetical protein
MPSGGAALNALNALNAPNALQLKPFRPFDHLISRLGEMASGCLLQHRTR